MVVVCRPALVRGLVTCVVSLLSVSNRGEALRPQVAPVHLARTLLSKTQSPGAVAAISPGKHWISHPHERRRVAGASDGMLPSASALFSSPANADDGAGNGAPKKWQRPFLSAKRAVLSLVAALIALPRRIRARFATLTRRGKVLAGLQLCCLALLLGFGAKTTADARLARRHRPAEVGYSTFLDLVDASGQGHATAAGPALRLDNVVISRDRVGFRVVADEAAATAPAAEARRGWRTTAQDTAASPKPSLPASRVAYALRPPAESELLDALRARGVPFRAASTKASRGAASVARAVIFLAYLLFLRKMYASMSGGGGGAGSGGPGKLATFGAGEPRVGFDDIEGIDDAKFEVMELVDTLRNPTKYAILGARAPTGLLLEGPPGTGKTMLARATAATAGVPLLYCSGSDFVEMFVGRGAARVRGTFARASKIAPCIVFVDELDALGKSRDLGGLGLGAGLRSNDEAEQTLNQLLACMDGLDSTKGICVMAATNRKDVLDPALVRPGRFDRIVKVGLPDPGGRERILRVHAKKLPGFTECSGLEEKRPGSLGKGAAVDLSAVAAVTKGLCGADLEFIVNEAAIRAVRRVSSRLRSGENPNDITPTVAAEDFEKSVADFYETRRPKGGPGDIFSSVLGK